MRLFVVCVLATSVMGCSFAATVQHRTAHREPSCGWYEASTAVDVVAIGVIAAVLATADLSDHEISSLAGAGFTSFLSSLDGVDATLRCHREVRERERLAREDAATHQRLAVREQAWQLTVAAETAARAGDCSRVWALDPQIAAIDVEMHDVVFARDVAVARCRSSVR
jgi:hypothetical protein